MSKVPGRAEDYLLPDELSIVMLKTFGGEQIICQVGQSVDDYLMMNPYTVDNDALYGKWITGIDLYEGNDPHAYEYPSNQVAVMLPTDRIHIRLLDEYKRAIGI